MANSSFKSNSDLVAYLFEGAFNVIESLHGQGLLGGSTCRRLLSHVIQKAQRLHDSFKTEKGKPVQRSG